MKYQLETAEFLFDFVHKALKMRGIEAPAKIWLLQLEWLL